jgi:hypothetical protein
VSKKVEVENRQLTTELYLISGWVDELMDGWIDGWVEMKTWFKGLLTLI